MRQHDGLGMTAPELVSELNSFVIQSRHPEVVFVILKLFQDLLEKRLLIIQGLLTFVSMTALGVRQYSPLTIHHSQLTTHNSLPIPSSTKYNIDS